jgi:hypothetical protein
MMMHTLVSFSHILAFVLAMSASASLVSLFPDDADIAKAYLLMIQTALIKSQIK